MRRFGFETSQPRAFNNSTLRPHVTGVNYEALSVNGLQDGRTAGRGSWFEFRQGRQLWGQLSLVSNRQAFWTSSAVNKTAGRHSVTTVPGLRTSASVPPRPYVLWVMRTAYSIHILLSSISTLLVRGCPESKDTKVLNMCNIFNLQNDAVNELPVHNFVFQHSRRHCPNIY
jgi:hypothetical protein